MCDIASTSLTLRPAVDVMEAIAGMLHVVVAGRISRCDVAEDDRRDDDDDEAFIPYNLTTTTTYSSQDSNNNRNCLDTSGRVTRKASRRVPYPRSVGGVLISLTWALSPRWIN